MATWYPGKNGRYSGGGDPIDRLIWGDNAPQYSPFYYLPYNQPTIDNNYFYWSLNRGYVAAEWTETLVDVGAGTTGIARGATGLVFTNAANEDDGAQTQHLAAFTPAANKEAIFYARMKTSEATQFDWTLGFASVDTTVIASPTGHFATFRKDDGDTTINGSTRDNSTTSDTADLITTFAADTEYDLGICIHGVGSVSFHYKLASAAVWTRVAKTTNLPTGALRPTFAELNGEATADSMTITKAIVAWML